MTYRAIGLMSGSSLDGLDIVFAELVEASGRWSYEIIAADCYAYDKDWTNRLSTATTLPALDYQLLHTAYGHYLGNEVNRFIEANGLHYKVGLVATHGHTTFHLPAQKTTAQLGDGAALAAVTGLPVVSDLRALDVAFSGQGAPIVPIAEKLLFPDYALFLNLGGIANLSIARPDGYIAFDVCPANRVLNLIAAEAGKEYDAGGALAASGQIHHTLLEQLNALPYYAQSHPKSLANSFGTDEVYPLVQSHALSPADAAATYVAHLVTQIETSIKANRPTGAGGKLLITGGGAFNTFVIEQLTNRLQPMEVEAIVPDERTVQYKEALAMALIGVLRWRQEYNVLSSVTGASRDSIGGAVWIGQEA